MEEAASISHRSRPIAILGIDGRNLLADVLSVDRRERRGEALVLVDDAVAKRKDVEPLVRCRLSRRPNSASVSCYWSALSSRLLACDPTM